MTPTPTLKQIAINSVQLRIGDAHNWGNLTLTQLEILLSALDSVEVLNSFRRLRDAIVELESKL